RPRGARVRRRAVAAVGRVLPGRGARPVPGRAAARRAARVRRATGAACGARGGRPRAGARAPARGGAGRGRRGAPRRASPAHGRALRRAGAGAPAEHEVPTAARGRALLTAFEEDEDAEPLVGGEAVLGAGLDKEAMDEVHGGDPTGRAFL